MPRTQWSQSTVKSALMIHSNKQVGQSHTHTQKWMSEKWTPQQQQKWPTLWNQRTKDPCKKKKKKHMAGQPKDSKFSEKFTSSHKEDVTSQAAAYRRCVLRKENRPVVGARSATVVGRARVSQWCLPTWDKQCCNAGRVVCRRNVRETSAATACFRFKWHDTKIGNKYTTQLCYNTLYN